MAIFKMTYDSTDPAEQLTTSKFDFDADNTTSSVIIIDAPLTKDISIWYPWALSTVYLVLGVGLILNTITVIAYVKSPLLSRGKPVHQLIFNMTISDLISCLVCQPFVLFQYSKAGERYISTRKLPCIGAFAGLVIGFDSTFTALLLITCERLFAIISPLQHMHRVTRRSARVAILVAWTLLTVKSSILFYWNKWRPYYPCIGVMIMPDLYSLYIYNTTLYTCMGLIVLFNILLGVVVVVAKRRARTMMASQTTAKSVRRQIKSSQNELKIVKIVFLTVCVLFVTWIPTNTLANMVLSFVTKGQAPPYDLLAAYHMTRAITLLGTVADPLIYFLKNSQCRDAVLKLFGRAEPPKPRPQQSVYSLDSNTVESKLSEVTVKTDA
ncbi:hypothetical protein CAPTEDRAFT_216418 [Capitella teleta]|uniref:G-protein coupled receptors family 1 profile domain-containing protein n=1 Tax=Capitella teleta TaxID=283909 RepID=R7TK40_CAPTE|nr:hypothetical protein CAPTEDRAFT_216418 [Capitella teleta]|eukprot:ELT91896.1 hypothetical protein CAPTEDRAFT_216418 [Capitella teleta]